MLTDRLEEILREVNSNISTLAKETGIPQQTISSWKSGKKPSIDKIKIICEHLNISADYLLEIQHTKEPDILNPKERLLLEQFRQIEDDVGQDIVLELTKREASRFQRVQEQELYPSKIG